VVADVAEKVGLDSPLDEVPVTVVAFEAIVVAAADDGLRRHVREYLKRGEVGARGRGVGRLVDSMTRLVVMCLVRGVPSW
jgi:hypothetical protein